jgi:hypothetical protein
LASVALAHRAALGVRAEDRLDEPSALPASTAPANFADTDGTKTHKLAFKFRLNQIVHYEISHEAEMTTHKNQDTEIARNTSRSRRHYRVLAVDGKSGAADLELTIDWVHMLASFDNGEGKPLDPIEFQSDDPKKHPEKFKHVLASIGQHARLRFSATGAPIRDPVKAASGAPRNPGSTAPAVTDGTLESYLFPLPEQPVAAGETWTERFDVLARDVDKNLVKIPLKRTFKLADVTNGVASIELRTAILAPVEDPAIAAQLIQREITGKISFDIERGLIISREWSIDNTIINPVGANSSMRAKSSYREKLLGSEAISERPSTLRPQDRSAATSKK